MTKVGILGSSDVGKTLAMGFKKHGYDVRIGSREGNKLTAWSAENNIVEASFEAVATHGEIVVMAVAGHAAEGIAKNLAEVLRGKVVFDTCNPISGAPVNGILPYFTNANDSLMERMQKASPDARFVKVFSSVGAPFMVNPNFGAHPTMFICGNDTDAKATAVRVLEQFGWEAEDVGGVEGARAIEPLCQLWCARGFLRNQWTHAFKLLKA
jgi:8-hydroxy-5-deazaflavin:NADPH oxidoreductase